MSGGGGGRQREKRRRITGNGGTGSQLWRPTSPTIWSAICKLEAQRSWSCDSSSNPKSRENWGSQRCTFQFKSKAQEPEAPMSGVRGGRIPSKRTAKLSFLYLLVLLRPLTDCMKPFAFHLYVNVWAFDKNKITISGSLLSPLIIKMQLQISGTKRGEKTVIKSSWLTVLGIRE